MESSFAFWCHFNQEGLNGHSIDPTEALLKFMLHSAFLDDWFQNRRVGKMLQLRPLRPAELPLARGRFPREVVLKKTKCPLKFPRMPGKKREPL